MTENIKKETQQATIPQELAESTPPVSPGHEYAPFLFQQMMEIQKTLGQLTQAVPTLTEGFKSQDTAIKTLSHKISVAQGAVWALLAVISASGVVVAFFLNKIWNAAILLLQTKPHP